jgi:hypothetical protein
MVYIYILWFYLNATDAGKKEEGCTINSSPTINPLLPIYVSETIL